MEQDLAPLIALGLLASQLTTLVRFLQATQWSRAFTTVLPWLAAFVALGIGAQVEATSSLVLPGVTQELADLNVWSLVYVAIVVGASGGFAHKAVVGVDNSQSAAEPPLGLPAGRG